MSVHTSGLTAQPQLASVATDAPLADRTVAVVHPAWHSCGAYEVYVGQARAYRALGARVITVACSDNPGYAPTSSRWRDYRRLTPELEGFPRHFAGVAFRRFFRPHYLRRLSLPYWRGDWATMRLEFSIVSDISEGMTQERPHLVHCNHFFCMPIAHRIARGVQIVLDTIDVQARQFDLNNDAARVILPPRATYASMLTQELDAMRRAAALLHLNVEEKAFFETRLPDSPHHLLYPAVRDMPGAPGGNDILIVASNNTANVESLAWFLRDVLPRAADPPVKIAGNVDGGLKAKDALLYEKYRANFLGRVDDLGAVYRRARLVLLPTISGTGLSIKAVEALSTGLPLIASPLAFRGMTLDPAQLRNVTVAPDADTFAAALREAVAHPRAVAADEIAASDTRRAYEAHFSTDAYAKNLAKIVLPLVSPA